MNRVKIYHGTTEEAFKKIIANGFDRGANVWHCSDLEETYFFNFNKRKEYDEDDDEQTHRDCIHDAFGNAMISAACHGSLSNKLYVFEIEIDEDLIQDDYSCPNMPTASSCDNETLNEHGKILNIYVSERYSPSLRLFILPNSDLLELDYLTEVEKYTLEELKKSDFDGYPYELAEAEIEKLIKEDYIL